ncbi:hypothetical protein [Candidatus Foliamicus sp.]
MNTNPFVHGAISDSDIAAALRSLPVQSAPPGVWQRVLERHSAQPGAASGRRRYWGGGLALAAGIAVAVIGARLSLGIFSGTPVGDGADNSAAEADLAASFPSADDAAAFAALRLESELAEMDLDALIAFSQFQEERLRALPVVDSARPGQVLKVDAFGLATELEDQIAILDEGLMPASLNAQDPSVPRLLLRERALLMDDLFSLRHAEAAQAGYFYADF